MILHVNSFNHVTGKHEEAEKYALKMAALINQKFPESNAQILRNFDGLFHRMHIIDTYESISAWEAARDANGADPDFLALWAECEGIFDWGSIESHFFQVVE